MQSNRMARKVKIVTEGVQLTELVKFGELSLEDQSVEVPQFERIVTILSGVEKVMPIACTFLIKRNDPNIKFLKTWRTDRDIKDVSLIEYDGSGNEYGRYLLSQCEAGQFKIPEYNAASPTYAQLEMTLYPSELIDLN